MSAQGPQPLTVPEPVVAPLIGRSSRPHAVNRPCKNLGKRHELATATVYIHANVRLAGIPPKASATDLEIAYAHRRAINAAVVDIFGDVSGAPVLGYDLLKCVTSEDDKKEEGERCYTLVVALQRQYADEMVTALSMITAGFCGGEILTVLVPSNASADIRAAMKLIVDVVGIADSPTNLLSAC